MIPLSSSSGVKTFPKALFFSLLLLVFGNIFLMFFDSFDELLLKSSLHNQEEQQVFYYFLIGPFLYPHWFPLIVNALFLWVFLPVAFEKLRAPVLFVFSALASLIALLCYRELLMDSGQFALVPELFVAAILGCIMRYEIWESTTTIVPGPWGFRIYDVPSYVLIFFYLFYMFIGSLLLDEPFRSAPMPYFLPILSFLLSFVASLVGGKALMKPEQSSQE